MSIIELDHLNKTFDYYTKTPGIKGSLKNLFHRETLKKEAVKDVSFAVEEGEILGLLGPNGAGKTTTLKMLSGILFPTSGHAVVNGYIPWERKNEFKRTFSIVMGQKNQLWWDLPASDSFYLNKCIYEIPDADYRRCIDELSGLLDVRDLMDVQVRRLSLGERMKMEIMAALIHRPRIIFLDEPTIGLDIVSQRKIREFLKYYNEQTKTTIILTSHYMRDVEELCRRCVIINQGSVVYNGGLADINQIFGNKKLLSIKMSRPAAREELERYGKLREYAPNAATLEIEHDKIADYSHKLIEQFAVVDFTVTDIPLEEGIEIFYRKEQQVSLVTP